MAGLKELENFLNSAHEIWEDNQSIKRLVLLDGEAISCVKWGNEYFISGNDIIRSVAFQIQARGISIASTKKFEEGIYSDLRNLKPGRDAILQPPHSDLLRYLHRHQCIRTQKKQKVFYWSSVPHRRMVSEALDRESKRQPTAIQGSNLNEFDVNLFCNMTWLQSQTQNQLINMSNELLFENLLYKDPLPSSLDSNSSYLSLDSIDYSKLPLPTILDTDQFQIYSEPKPLKQNSLPLSSNEFYIPPTSRDSSGSSLSSNGDIINDPKLVNFFYYCQYPHCPKKFKRKEHLRRHFQSHTGVRPYICTMCSKSFARKDNLHQHIKTHRF